MADRPKEIAIGAFLTVAVVAELWGQTWSERAAIAFAFGALGLVTVLPQLRKDEGSDRAFVRAVVALGLLVASAVMAVYVVHSWAWLAYAAAVMLVIVGFEAWDRYQEVRAVEPGIADDIDERQRRQDEQLVKTFPHM